MAFVSMYCSLYYNIILAWVLHFLFASFRSKLNWNLCTNFWNDDSCINRGSYIKPSFLVNFYHIVYNSETVFGQLTRSLKNNISIVYCNNLNKSSIADNCTQGVFATAQYFKYFSTSKFLNVNKKVYYVTVGNMYWV